MKIYLIGKQGFIAKNIYKLLKRKKITCILCSHENIEGLEKVTNDDVIINTAGVNNAETLEEYEDGNLIFLQKIVKLLRDKTPYFLHLSSYMVIGFQNKDKFSLSEKNRYFVDTKLAGEAFLEENVKENLCILRPSNIFGYDCRPYYNNIISTLVYEKLLRSRKITRLNRNSYRNFLTVEALCLEILECVKSKRKGTWNVLSNNTVSLETVVGIIWETVIPSYFSINDGNEEIPNMGENNIVIQEDFFSVIKKLERDMKIYLKILDSLEFEKKSNLSQERGDMVEISDMNSKRLYKITINPGQFRGNHFHYHQIEEFFTNRGSVVYLFAVSEHIDIMHVEHAKENDLIRVFPNIVHTLVNDSLDGVSEVIVLSTQKYIQGIIPDTCYINII